MARMVNLYLKDDLVEKLDTIAQKWNQSRSFVARMLLELILQQHPELLTSNPWEMLKLKSVNASTNVFEKSSVEAF